MEVKKTEKANLDRSSLLYFLVGLNVVLLGVLGFFNWKKYEAVPVVEEQIAEIEPATEAVLIDIPEPETPPPPPEPDEPPPPPPPPVPQEIEQVPDPVEPPKLQEQKIEPPKITSVAKSTGPTKKVDLSGLKTKTQEAPKEERVTEPVTVNRVAEMAIYPGCEKLKGDKRKLIACFQQEISKDILRYLDMEFPNVDKQSVAVRLKFHVTTEGYIADVDPEMGDDVFKPQAKRALEKAADYLKRKGNKIEPAKMADGSNATLIFNIPVKLNNPNY